ncbi:hypothetical protein GN956_G9790 [Arapaima gigas]
MWKEERLERNLGYSSEERGGTSSAVRPWLYTPQQTLLSNNVASEWDKGAARLAEQNQTNSAARSPCLSCSSCTTFCHEPTPMYYSEMDYHIFTTEFTCW